MPTATLYPEAGFIWDAPQLDFLGDGAAFSLADAAQALFDFAPYDVSFDPGGVPGNFLDADGEVLTSDGEALSW